MYITKSNLANAAKWFYGTRLGNAICNAAISLALVILFGLIALVIHHFVHWLQVQDAPPLIVGLFVVVEHLLAIADAILIVGSVFIHAWHYLKALAKA